MRQIVEISPTTLKRIQNYQQVADNEMKKNDQRQWMEMTLDNMQAYGSSRQKAEHIATVSAYASFLFQVQNGLMPYRQLFGEHLLRNALVALLGELHIPVKLIDVPSQANPHHLSR